MKSNADMNGNGAPRGLRPEAAASWAAYLSRWLAAFAARGIRVSWLTVQNEPLARKKGLPRSNSGLAVGPSPAGLLRVGCPLCSYGAQRAPGRLATTPPLRRRRSWPIIWGQRWRRPPPRAATRPSACSALTTRRTPSSNVRAHSCSTPVRVGVPCTARSHARCSSSRYLDRGGSTAQSEQCGLGAPRRPRLVMDRGDRTPSAVLPPCQAACML